MDQSKQRRGVANYHSHNAAKGDGDSFENGSGAESPGGKEEFVNEYAAASQAFEAGRKPRPIEDSHSRQPRPRNTFPKDHAVQTGRPTATGNTNEQTAADEQPNSKALPPVLDASRASKSPIELPRLMRVAEVAAYLGVSISKIWRLLKSNPGFPRPIRMNGTTRWDRLDIDCFIEDSKVRGRRDR